MQAAIVLSRGIHLAGMLSFLGMAAFRSLILSAVPAVPSSLRARFGWVTWISLAVALASGLAWLGIETASMAGTDSLSDTIQALPLVAEATRFGQVMMARLGLLLLAGLIAWRRPRFPSVVLVLTVMAAALQGLMAHAGAGDGGQALLVSEVLHVPAAGIWFGALLPLSLSIGLLSPAQGGALCERFTPIGLACVLVIGGSGIIQAISLVGSLPGLLGTPYGHIVLLKVALFSVALVLALLNRLWLTDRLVDTGRAGALRLSVAIEALVGCAIVLAAGWLASGRPAIHEQLDWPLSWQFILERIDGHPERRAEVIASLLMIGAAVLLCLGTLFVQRRYRARFACAALVVLAGVVAWRGPSPSLLTSAAWPDQLPDPGGPVLCRLHRAGAAPR